MEEWTEVLAECELSDWATRLATSTDPGDRETLLFLERAFMHLPRSAQPRVAVTGVSREGSGTTAIPKTRETNRGPILQSLADLLWRRGLTGLLDGRVQR